MKPKNLLIAIALLLCGQSYAQSGREIHGTVRDSTKRSMIWSTVYLISGRDSTRTTTDTNGFFVFKSVISTDIDIAIYSIGYQTFKRHYIFPPGNSTIDLENIVLKEGPNVLTGRNGPEKPINLKVDTIVLPGAAVYKVHENLQPKETVFYVMNDYGDQINPASTKKSPVTGNESPPLDSLSKKLLNYEVDSFGHLTISGKPITKTHTSDRDFTVVKSLPDDIIEKIQVIDDYEEQGTLSGKKKSANRSDSIINGIPVTHKEDTVMYNVGDYKTKGNGRLIDLLKKLPGLDVKTDETMNFQGQQVKKIRINGKEYFGNKLKKAMKNIHADLIKSVLLIDDYSNSAMNTFKGGEPDKIMNIILK
jgi:hypothetical protein